MTLNPILYKIVQFVFISAVIFSILVLGRVGFVMGMAHYVNMKAAEGESDPAEIYYLLQAYTLDFTEPYKAFYNAGTVYAGRKNYDAAEVLLSESLKRVDYVYNECLVRNNLAYVYEQQGDYYLLSEMSDIAKNYYEKAITVVSESPNECFPPSPPPSEGDQTDENSEPSEGEETGDPSQEGLPNQSAQPDVSGEGKQMEQTKDRSETKADDIESQDGDSPEDQIKNEMDQSKGSYENSNDQDGQSQNENESTDKPW